MTTSRTSRWGDPQAGGAGKGLLMFLGAASLLAFGLWMLWKPVFQPMIGEAIPTRVTEVTAFPVPVHDPQVVLTIEPDWVVQRGVFDDATALVRTPDLGLEITVDTWEHGTGPSLEAAMREVLDQEGEARIERIAAGVIARSAFVGEGRNERLIVAIGNEHDPLERAVAIVTAEHSDRAPEDADLSDAVPAVAAFVAGIEVVE